MYIYEKLYFNQNSKTVLRENLREMRNTLETYIDRTSGINKNPYGFVFVNLYV